MRPSRPLSRLKHSQDLQSYRPLTRFSLSVPVPSRLLPKLECESNRRVACTSHESRVAATANTCQHHDNGKTTWQAGCERAAHMRTATAAHCCSSACSRCSQSATQIKKEKFHLTMNGRGARTSHIVPGAAHSNEQPTNRRQHSTARDTNRAQTTHEGKIETRERVGEQNRSSRPACRPWTTTRRYTYTLSVTAAGSVAHSSDSSDCW